MNVSQLRKLSDKCEEKISDLADLKRYPPFSIFFEKSNKLDSYILEKFIGPMQSGQNIIVINDNEEFEIDDSKTKAIKIWENISDSLKKGDDDVPGLLKDDVEEARLYRARHKNSPREALLKASEVYEEADISVVPR